MVTRRSTSISIRNGNKDGRPEPTTELLSILNALRDLARIAAKHGFKLGTHNHYSPKTREHLTEIRRSFLELRMAYPQNRFPAVSTQLDELENLVSKLEQGLTLPPRELRELVEQILFRIGSDLRVAIRATDNQQGTGVPFITPEILNPGVYRKILEEANTCFDQNCANACAAMLRRLVESLIIEAFETHGIESKIRDTTTGEYQELKALIGKAIAEAKLKLGRNTKTALPNLKFLGDLSLHARRHIVRRDDLLAIRNDARIALEELAHHLPNK